MHRVRLYPTARQEARLRFMLGVTRDLYNALLEQRRDCWKSRQVRITTKQQYAELTDLRRDDARCAAVYRECQDAVLHRLDSPRLAGSRSSSRTAIALKFGAGQKRVRIPGVGTVPLRKGREIPAFRRAFVLEKNGRWWAIFECKREPMALPGTGTTLGVDRGVHVLAATSDGELIRNGRFANRHGRVVGGHARACGGNGTRCDRTLREPA